MGLKSSLKRFFSNIWAIRSIIIVVIAFFAPIELALDDSKVGILLYIYFYFLSVLFLISCFNTKIREWRKIIKLGL